GCGGGGGGVPAAAPEPERPEPGVPHGQVAGAEEAGEPQPRLVVAGAETGTVGVLDLITGEFTGTGTVEGVTDIGGDGRFAYVTAGDGSVHIVDGGAWTVDHGDHSHYYRAPARLVGAVPGRAPAGAHGGSSAAAVTSGDGTVTLVDREALEAGTLTEAGSFGVDDPSGAAAVPLAEHVVVAAADGAVEVRGADGEPVAALDEPCPRPEGEAATPYGVVLGCADGALLVTGEGDTFTGEKIAYPEQAADRAREFTHRSGSATLAAVAGERGVWTLDVSGRAWAFVATGPVLAANAPGDGATLLTLTADGVLHAFDTGTGEETARTPLLAGPPPDGTAPVIEIDAARAYVNDPAAGAVHEIDYRDDLRIARTLELGFAPAHMVETGR
ncbi:hypothetical protein, partial [Streptomyces sp. URMC 129]|uniref:hypothetical protein n=1 Tax=Streptomyces sp. URMC 129 TaxID=3423407 RepID=UPI003F1A2E2F